MPLVPMTALLRCAVEGGYGIGYFEAWDLRSLEAVLDAAEAERAPVVLGFGAMMVDGAWLERRGIAMLGAAGRTLAERARSPVSLIFNEAETVDQAFAALDAGFNAVLLRTDNLEPRAALKATRRLVERAHAAGASVEAEVGRLPDDARPAHASETTDPDAARAFVEETGIDCLAVSIGNVHLKTDGWASIDAALLEAIHRAVPLPLAVHGGSSFPPDAVPHAVRHGVAKFNVGTVLKAAFRDALLREASAMPPDADVHVTIGSHTAGDLLAPASDALRERVRALIRLYGSSGRALHGEPDR